MAGFRGRKHTKETKAKMSATRTGMKASKEAKAKMSARMIGNQYALGFKHSKAMRAKMSATMMGNQNFLGHKHSEATRAELSAAAQVRMQTPEGKAHFVKMNQASQTPEAYVKISVAAQTRAQTPEGRGHLVKMNQASHAATGPTKLERALYRMLDVFGWEYDTQVLFASYIVDAYIPGLHLALEADGPFHFEGNPFTGTTPEQEAQATKDRDAFLLEHCDLQVWHFTEGQLNAIPM